MAEVPGSYTSYGYGTGVHTIAGTSAFPNFQNGAVNNHYPLAQAQPDASPPSDGKATSSDTGPLANTPASQDNHTPSSGNPPPPPNPPHPPPTPAPHAFPTAPHAAHAPPHAVWPGESGLQAPGSRPRARGWRLSRRPPGPGPRPGGRPRARRRQRLCQAHQG